MSDEALNFRITAQDLASAKFAQIHREVGGLGQELKKSVLTGVGLGAGIGAFNLLGTAVEHTLGFFKDSVKAAEENQVSLAALTTALKTNDSGWSGNMDAINKVIESRLRLGFTDNEQAASLASLVAMTKNYSSALDIERTAMDLARLRHVSLETASTMLGRAFEGNAAGLKRLGIVVANGTKGYDLLRVVQGRLAGQAEAFSKTTAGASAAMAAEFDNLQQQVGNALLPVLTDLFHVLAESVIPAIRTVVEVIKAGGPLTDALKLAAEGLALVVGVRLVGGLLNATRGLLGFSAASTQAAAASGEAAVAGSRFASVGLGPIGIAAALALPAIDALQKAGDGLLMQWRHGAEYGNQYKAVIKAVGDNSIAQGIAFGVLGEAAKKQGRSLSDVTSQFLNLIAAGSSLEDALKAVKDTTVRALGPVADSARGMGKRMIDRYSDGVREGRPGVRFALDSVAEAAHLAWLAQQDQIVAAARALPMDIANAIKKGRQDVADAWKVFLDDQKNVQTAAQKSAYYNGILSSKALAAGLKDQRPEVRAEAQAIRDNALAELHKLRTGAYDAAVNAGVSVEAGLASREGAIALAADGLRRRTVQHLRDNDNSAFTSGWVMVGNFASGMLAARYKVEIAGLSVAETAARYIKLRSPAEAGPLSEDSSLWGTKLVQAMAAGMSRATPLLAKAALGAAGAAAGAAGAMPGGMLGRAPYAGMPGVLRAAGMTNLTINVNAPLGTPAAGQALARALVPELTRELRRQSVIA